MATTGLSLGITREPALLADLNFAEWCRAVTQAAGGRILETGGVLLWSETPN